MFDPGLQNHFSDLGFILKSIKGGSYAGVFLLSIIVSYVFPFPEAILLLLFGFVARSSHLSILYVLFWGCLGSIIGDNVVYRLSFFGNKYVERFNVKMRQSKLIKYEHLVADNIGFTIYFLRFVTGVRFFGPVISGTLGVRWKKFLLFNASATALHTIFFVLLGYWYRGKIVTLIAEVEIIRNVLLFSSTVIVGALIAFFAAKKNS